MPASPTCVVAPAAAPAGPVAPVAPVDPAGPCGPAAPAAPAAPFIPFIPFMPVRPWDPVAPVAPVAPAAPVAPVAPVAPFGSAISIQLASEHATSNPLLAEYARSPALPALQGTLAQLSAVHSHSADVKVTYPTVPLFELVQLGRPVTVAASTPIE